MIFELLYLGMLLLHAAIWFVRVLVQLHVAVIVVALPAGLLVKAGVVHDVDAFALVSCAWAVVLLCAWNAAVAAHRRAHAARWASRPEPGRTRGAPARVLRS